MEREKKERKKREEKERDRGTEDETPNPSQAIDVHLGNKGQNGKHKNNKMKETGSGSQTRLPRTI